MTAETCLNDQLRLEIVDDPTRMEALAGPWSELLDSLDSPLPFASHDWVCAWWRHFGGTRRLHLVLGWRAERLVGIAPLMLSKERRLGIPLRRLGTLYNEHVQDLDFPICAQHLDAFLDALWEHLTAARESWDLLELCQLRRGAPSLAVLQRRVEAEGRDSFVWEEGESPWLPLHGDWDTYVATLSKSRRSEYRRQLRKLAERGDTGLEVLSTAEGLDEALDEGLRLEALGWKGSAGTAILNDPTLHAFYRDLAHRMAARGALRLHFLRVGEQRIAFQFCLQMQGSMALLKTAYDPAWHSHSPAQLLVWLVLERAFAEGLREYDLLGDREDWKMVWARDTRPHVWFSVLGASLPARLYGLAKRRVAPLAKRLLRRSPPPGTVKPPLHLSGADR